MNIYNSWTKALRKTQIIRSRVRGLLANQATVVPYILLCESSINPGDTVVRRGEIMVERPSLILPPNIPQFEGFEFNSESSFDQNTMLNFLLVRGVTMPSLKYNNKTSSLEVYEGPLDKAIAHHRDILQQQENVQAGLIVGPEDCWQFSVLIYVCSQIARNADNDIRYLLKQWQQQQE